MRTPSMKHLRMRRLSVIAAAPALALLGLSPAIYASDAMQPASVAAPARAPALAAAAQPTHAQMHLLHLMDPALHAGARHHHGPHHGPGAHDCPHDCAQSVEGGPQPEPAEAPSATVNGTLTVKTAEATHTIAMHDVMHGGTAPCSWPVGGSIQLTGADNVAHTATFAPECGHVTLDGASLALPVKHEMNPGHGGNGLQRKMMGRQAPVAPQMSP